MNRRTRRIRGAALTLAAEGQIEPTGTTERADGSGQNRKLWTLATTSLPLY